MHVFIKEALASASKTKWDPVLLDRKAKEAAIKIKSEYAERIKKKKVVPVEHVEDQFEEQVDQNVEDEVFEEETYDI